MALNDYTPWLLCFAVGLTAGCGSDTAADTGTDAGVATDAGMGGEAGTGDLDWQEVSCDEERWEAGECAAAATTATSGCAATHIPETTSIDYDEGVVACGPHRPQWAKWGGYEYLPPQRYLHNLEHGGIAFLYHPCAPQSVIDELQAIASAVEADDRGPFRYVLSPTPELEQTVAVLAWGQAMESHCVDVDEVNAFIGEHYRNAPEDVASDGSYERGWLGR
jgi:hypothetical protein